MIHQPVDADDREHPKRPLRRSGNKIPVHAVNAGKKNNANRENNNNGGVLVSQKRKEKVVVVVNHNAGVAVAANNNKVVAAVAVRPWVVAVNPIRTPARNNNSNNNNHPSIRTLDMAAVE